MVTVTDWLNYANSVGVFSYVVPFLLIFAVVFAILKKSKLLGDNRGVNTIVAVAVGLLALQFDIVGLFFANIFPKMGVFLAVVLVIMLFLGFVGVPFEKNGKPTGVKWVGIVGAILVVLWAASGFWNIGGFGYSTLYLWFGNYFWGLVILGLVIGAIVWVGKDSTPSRPSGE